MFQTLFKSYSGLEYGNSKRFKLAGFSYQKSYTIYLNILRNFLTTKKKKVFSDRLVEMHELINYSFS
jgi:hypothetical protein